LLQTFLTFQRISRTYDLCKWQILAATPSPGMPTGGRSTRLYNLLNETARYLCPFTGQQAFLRALIKYMDLLF
jgi:hypothetical protein